MLLINHNIHFKLWVKLMFKHVNKIFNKIFSNIRIIENFLTQSCRRWLNSCVWSKSNNVLLSFGTKVNYNPWICPCIKDYQQFLSPGMCRVMVWYFNTVDLLVNRIYSVGRQLFFIADKSWPLCYTPYENSQILPYFTSVLYLLWSSVWFFFLI